MASAAETDTGATAGEHGLGLEAHMKALKFKEAGNVFFRAGEFKQALRQYHQAILHLKSVLSRSSMGGFASMSGVAQSNPIPADLTTQMEDLMVTILNNMSTIHFKGEQWDKVVRTSTDALAKRPANVKALYARARAYWALDRLAACERDVADGLKAKSDDKDLLALQAQIDQRNKQYVEKQRQQFKGMFDRM